VRHNAIRALAQIASDHTPEFQQRYHKTVLPAFIAALDDPVARLQSYAAAGIFNFLNDLGGGEDGNDGNDDDDADGSDIPLAQYYDLLMTKLMALLRSAPNHVKGQVLTSFAACSSACPKEFLKVITRLPIYHSFLCHMYCVMIHVLIMNSIMIH
jgi:hypothetical protein